MHPLSRRQVVTGLAGALCLVRSPLLAADPAYPKLRRGINLHNLMNWPDARREGDHTAYVWPAFQGSRYGMTDDELRALVSAGFDFARLTVDPSIFIEATGANAAAIEQHAKDTVARLLHHGLAVVFDLHPVAVNPVYAPGNLVRDETSPQFRAYADMVARMALMLDGFPQDRVAFELMNEPLVLGTAPADMRRWQAMLEILHGKARSGSASLPLILSGAQGSDRKALTLLDLRPFRQSNVLYTFHYYEPFAFTHQGVPRLQTQCLSDLHWPEDDANADEALARAQACIASAPVGPAERDTLGRDTDHLVKGYKRWRFGAANAERGFDEVGRWAADNGIANARILLGEFGCVSSMAGPALRDQRASWLRNVVRNAERLGFAWAYWAYKGLGGMQLLDPETGTLDAETLDALQLHAPG